MEQAEIAPLEELGEDTSKKENKNLISKLTEAIQIQLVQLLELGDFLKEVNLSEEVERAVNELLKEQENGVEIEGLGIYTHPFFKPVIRKLNEKWTRLVIEALSGYETVKALRHLILASATSQLAQIEIPYTLKISAKALLSLERNHPDPEFQTVLQGGKGILPLTMIYRTAANHSVMPEHYKDLDEYSFFLLEHYPGCCSPRTLSRYSIQAERNRDLDGVLLFENALMKSKHPEGPRLVVIHEDDLRNRSSERKSDTPGMLFPNHYEGLTEDPQSIEHLRTAPIQILIRYSRQAQEKAKEEEDLEIRKKAWKKVAFFQKLIIETGQPTGKAYGILALALEKMGNLEEALEACQKCLKIEANRGATNPMSMEQEQKLKRKIAESKSNPENLDADAFPQHYTELTDIEKGMLSKAPITKLIQYSIQAQMKAQQLTDETQNKNVWRTIALFQRIIVEKVQKPAQKAKSYNILALALKKIGDLEAAREANEQSITHRGHTAAQTIEVTTVETPPISIPSKKDEAQNDVGIERPAPPPPHKKTSNLDDSNLDGFLSSLVREAAQWEVSYELGGGEKNPWRSVSEADEEQLTRIIKKVEAEMKGLFNKKAVKEKRKTETKIAAFRKSWDELKEEIKSKKSVNLRALETLLQRRKEMNE